MGFSGDLVGFDEIFHGNEWDVVEYLLDIT